MNFFHSLFKSKLDAMRAAAPRASIHLLHESNGFSIYLDEATAVRKVTQLGVLTDHAEDILEETVPVLFVPLEQCIKFVEEVTAHHSVGLVDVILADKVHAARYVMYAYFLKRVSTFQDHVDELVSMTKFDQTLAACADHVGRLGAVWTQGQPAPIKVPEFLAPVAAIPVLLAEKDSLDADFWG